MIKVEPVEVRVRTGWFDGRPREITWAGRHLSVLHLRTIRHEDAAYPVSTGPRTVFEVETAEARIALTFRHRTRSWTIDGLDEAARAA
jgi:hypothetical protein